MKSALLVIDVQQAACTGRWAMHDADGVVDRINGLAARARAAGVPVIFVQHAEEEGPFQFGADGWQHYDRLDVEHDDIRVHKQASDSFLRTELDDLLKSRGIETLIICGMQSEYCVDSTVRGALARGYPVTLVADGHTTMDNDVLTAAQISAHHNATLGTLTSFGPLATPMRADDVRFEASHSGMPMT
jgi:nicotinamidase-related amidase